MHEPAAAPAVDKLRRLAMSEWSASAAARVISTRVHEDRAKVALLVDAHYEYWQYYVNHGEGWESVAEGNGPTDGWDDPKVIHW
jgi:hypothetical protein